MSPRGHKPQSFPHLQHNHPRLGEKLGTSGPRSRRALGVSRFSFNFGSWGGPRRELEGRPESRPAGLFGVPDLPQENRGGGMKRKRRAQAVRFVPPKCKGAQGSGWGSAAERRSAAPRRLHAAPPAGRRPRHCAPAARPGRLRGGSPRAPADQRAPSPDRRAAPLRSGLPRRGRRVPTAAGGSAPAHAGRSASGPDPRRSPPPGAQLGFRSPRRAGGSGDLRSRWKVSGGAAEPPPQDHRPQPPPFRPVPRASRLRVLAVPATPPTCFRGRPGLGRPVARSCPPEPEPRRSAEPGAGAADCLSERASERVSKPAGGWSRGCCCRASPHPPRPSVPPSPPRSAPSSLLVAPSLPPSFSRFGPFRPCSPSLARSLALSYLSVPLQLSFRFLFLWLWVFQHLFSSPCPPLHLVSLLLIPLPSLFSLSNPFRCLFSIFSPF